MATDSAPEVPPGLAGLLGFQLAKCGWWMEQRVEAGLAPLGIRVRHFLVLCMVGNSDGLSQQRLAAYVALDPTLMVALVDDLERRGLCERTRNPADRRRYDVRITDAGRELLERAMVVADAVGDEVFGPLGRAETRQLADTIGRVMAPFWAEQAVRPRTKPRA